MKTIKTNRNKIFIIKAIIAAILFSFSFDLASASEISPEKVIQLTNQERMKRGVSLLEENQTLNKVAQDKLRDMIEKNYFAHTSPEGKSPWIWFLQEKYDYQYAGENLAINFYSAEEQMKAWMESETHRKNILNPVFHQMGAASAVGKIDEKESIITVQVFGTPDVENNIAKSSDYFENENRNLKERMEKQAPAVLAVEKSDGSGGQNGSGFNVSNWEKIILGSMMFLFSLSLAVTAFMISFLERVFSEIRRRYLEKGEVAVIRPEEYLRVLFSLDKSNLRGLKVIRIESG